MLQPVWWIRENYRIGTRLDRRLRANTRTKLTGEAAWTLLTRLPAAVSADGEQARCVADMRSA
jgi:hypothetical protein